MLLLSVASLSAASSPGIIVEEVAPGGAASRAGVQPGDLLLSWETASSDGPTGVDGFFESPFDLQDLETTKGSWVPVRVTGLRHGKELTAVLATGDWLLRSKPNMDPANLGRYENAEARVAAGDVDGSVEALRGAAVIAARRTESDLAAWLLVHAGESLAARDRWEEAQRLFAEAQSQAASDARQAAITEVEAKALALRQPARAEAAFKIAYEIRRRMPGAELLAAADLNAQARLIRGRDDLAGAEALYREALVLAETRVPGTLVAAESLSQIAYGACYRSLEEALPYAQRASAIRERLAPESLGMVQSLTLLGGIALRSGDLSSARISWTRALALAERVQPKGQHVATGLNNLAIVAFEQGDHATSEQFLRRALALEEDVNPRSLDTAVVLGNLGELALARGDFAAAQALYERSLAIAEEVNPDGLRVASAIQSLAEVERQAGDLRRAAHLYARAVRLLEQRVPDSREVAEALTNQARLVLDTGDVATAEALVSRSLRLSELLARDSLPHANRLQLQGEIAERQGDRVRAAEFYARALSVRRRLAPGSRLEAESLYALGLLRRQEGHIDEALDLMGRAVDALDHQRGRLGGPHHGQERFGGSVLAIYYGYLDLLLRNGETARAFHVLERSRGRVLLALLAERDLVLPGEVSVELERERRRTDAEYEQTQAALVELNPAAEAATMDRQLLRLKELRDRQTTIAQEVREASPRLADLRYPTGLDAAGVAAALDPGTVFLSYAVGSERTFLFVLSAARAGQTPNVEAFTIPIGEADLRKRVQAWRGQVELNMPPPAFLSEADAFYTLLLRPAEARLRGAQRLLICPDGPLHGLPFAALRRRGRYLAEWKPVHLVQSGSVYARIAGADPAIPYASDLVAFGDPRYESGRLEDLPATRLEVEAIAGLFAKSTVHVGENATEERAKALGKGVRYIHFACHGLIDERTPLDSSLALSPPDAPPDGRENGMLQAWEIFERVRVDADLVTLSTCRSAAGTEARAEGILGLTRAFQYAGARSVVASLWSIGDKSTLDFMQRFYGFLQQGEAKDEALRHAQQAAIRAGHQPARWAAFQLYGDCGRPGQKAAPKLARARGKR